MSDYTEAEYDAAAAVKNAPEVPEIILKSTPVGKCEDCGNEFTYGRGTGRWNLDPCPECESHEWQKWGYVTDDGKLVPNEEVSRP